MPQGKYPLSIISLLLSIDWPKSTEYVFRPLSRAPFSKLILRLSFMRTCKNRLPNYNIAFETKNNNV